MTGAATRDGGTDDERALWPPPRNARGHLAPRAEGPAIATRAPLSRRKVIGADGTRLYPAALSLCAILLGYTATQAPGAAVLGAAALGGLFVLHRVGLALATAALLAAGLLVLPDARHSLAFWGDLGIAVAVAVFPRGLAPALLQAPRWSWLLALVLGSTSLFLHFMLPAALAGAGVLLAMACAAFIGAGIARHLAVVDARLLAWGDGGLVNVTRDLLLGRITSGMLHDLAQPLNVISMANANLDYIIERLDVDEDSRQQLQERVRRIASHTEGAASILTLFRWFGRDGRDGGGNLTVRSALECAVAATRSNVRHHAVSVRLSGDALDHPVPVQHGALEMMAVAALLSAFGSFLDRDGRKLSGNVRLDAGLTASHVIVTVECSDAKGQPAPGRQIDEATLWLVEQVAREAAGDFRCQVRDRQPVRFVIRLSRQDR